MQPLFHRSCCVFHRMLQRALPDDSHTPAKRPELLHVPFVSIDIAEKLLLPEVCVGPRSGGIAAPIMPMPEAAVDEHHSPVFREHKVRCARQPSDVKSIAKSPGKKKGAKCPFRPSVLAANARHHAAALWRSRYAHGLGCNSPGCHQKPPVRTSSANASEEKRSTDRWLGA